MLNSSWNAKLESCVIKRETAFAEWYLSAKQWITSTPADRVSLADAPPFPEVAVLGHELEKIGIRVPRGRESDKKAFIQEIMAILLQRATELYGATILVGRWRDNGLCIAKRVDDDIAYFSTVYQVDGNLIDVAVNYDAARIIDPSSFEQTLSSHHALVSHVRETLCKQYRLSNVMSLLRGIKTSLVIVYNAVLNILLILMFVFTLFLSRGPDIGDGGFFSSGFRKAYRCWNNRYQVRNEAERFLEHYLAHIPSAALLEPRVGPDRSVRSLLEGSRDHQLYVERFLDLLKQIQAMTDA